MSVFYNRHGRSNKACAKPLCFGDEPDTELEGLLNGNSRLKSDKNKGSGGDCPGLKREVEAPAIISMSGAYGFKYGFRIIAFPF